MAQENRSSPLPLERANFSNWEDPATAEDDIVEETQLDPILFPLFDEVETESTPQPAIIGEEDGNNANNG